MSHKSPKMTEPALLTFPLADIVWMELQLARGGIGALLASVDEALSQSDETRPERQREVEQLRLVQAALLLDADWLRRHPETLFQCLWNRCWWYDHPEAASFYADTPDQEWGPQGPPWQRGVGLYQLAEQWRAQLQTRSPDRPWLRSLRPPVVQLDDSLVTSYQLPRDSQIETLFFADAATIEIVGTERALWEHHQAGEEPVHFAEQFAWQSGTRQSLQAPSRASDAKLYKTQTYPTTAIVTPDTGEELVVIDTTGLFDDDLMVTDLHISPDQRWLVVSGWIWDYDGAFAIYEIQPARSPNGAPSLLRSHAGELATYPDAVGFSQDSRCVVFSVGGQIDAIDLERGRLLWSIAHLSVTTSQLALWVEADGALILAQLTSDRRLQIRRDPHRQTSIRRVGLKTGIGHIQFSERGTRLLTQPWLWDGNSGALIAHTGDGLGNYLEGGPPTNPRYLTDDHIIRVEGSISRYDIQRGTWERPTSQAYLYHGNTIAYAPSGAYLTVAHRSDQRCVLMRVTDGKELHRWEGMTPTAVAFAPGDQWLLLAQGDERPRIDVYRLDDLQSGPAVAFGGHDAVITSIVLSRDGDLVISAGESEALRLWRLSTGDEIHHMPLEQTETTTGTRYEYDDEGNHTEHPYSQWAPTATALARLEGWGGFRSLATPHKWHTSFDPSSSTFCICLPEGEAVAWHHLTMPPLVHPRGHIWASALKHITLEGDPFAPRRAKIAAQQTEQLEAALFED